MMIMFPKLRKRKTRWVPNFKTGGNVKTTEDLVQPACCSPRRADPAATMKRARYPQSGSRKLTYGPVTEAKEWSRLRSSRLKSREEALEWASASRLGHESR